MKCESVSNKLSDFMDGKLDSNTTERISLHIGTCSSCQGVLQSLQRIGEWMREDEVTVDTEAIWSRIESALPAQKQANTRLFLAWGVPGLAVAASLVLVLASLVLKPYGDRDIAKNRSHTKHEHARDALAVDFRQVIDLAQTSPQLAISSLIDKYDGKQLDAEAATKFIGYRPCLFDSVPDGFARVSTHVLNMPCCKCTASICTRQDGRSLLVFEHKDEQPVWFGDLPSIATQCSGTQCRIIESAGQLAVSWKHKDRQFTMIGAADLAEVSTWIEKMSL